MEFRRLLFRFAGSGAGAYDGVRVGDGVGVGTGAGAGAGADDGVGGGVGAESEAGDCVTQTAAAFVGKFICFANSLTDKGLSNVGCAGVSAGVDDDAGAGAGAGAEIGRAHV